MSQASVLLKLFTSLVVALIFVGFPVLTNGLGFTYNGFRSPANLTLHGLAKLTNDGLLMLTNDTISQTGYAFHPDPIHFKNSSNKEIFSFSTTFAFAMRSPLQTSTTGGLAFVIAPTKDLHGSAMEFLGLFNSTTNGSATNHIFAVELDPVKNTDTNDINGNHVGIDINNINSIMQKEAGYYPSDRDSLFDNLTLSSGERMQVWVDYNGTKKQIKVTLAPWEASGKPKIPLLDLIRDLSPVLQETMYVGFSAATGPVPTTYYILGWSFGSQGEVAQQLHLSKLPRLPRIGPKRVSNFVTRGLPLICLFTLFASILIIRYYMNRRKKFAEVLEDWEVVYGPHRFKYKDLYTATKGFRDSELLGAGGFGKVYKGVLKASQLQIAVKKISHESKQGIREFIAEIVSIGRMSHRNLVPLLGYSRRKGELLLVYEYMPNGSLDKFLYGPQKFILINWARRFQIIKGVASGLFYLHEGWEKVVVHRDIKSSNVLIDGEMNGRLGDFGLAKLYDHGSVAQTTHVVGTVGYLAPEHYRTGRPTTNTDVYAFGAFLLEVVSGKRPIEPRSPTSDLENLILVEWVFQCWKEGRILDAVDPKLSDDFVEDEAELGLKLGLLCSNSEAMARPSMQQVVLYLDQSMPLPELSSVGIFTGSIASGKGFEDIPTTFSYKSSTRNSSSQFSHMEQESSSSGGR